MIDRICTHRDIPLRERVLWRMLYESASRAAAVLALNVEDCDFDNRRAKVTVKGGDIGWVVWGRGTALLLPRYLKGRESGPLFCSDRRPGPARRAATPSRDICPETDRMRLGYDRARTLIKKHTGLNLHALRHSAATHLVVRADSGRQLYSGGNHNADTVVGGAVGAQGACHARACPPGAVGNVRERFRPRRR